MSKHNSRMSKNILKCALLITSSAAYALPFNIVPLIGTTLPKDISPNQKLTAYYTIQNNTRDFQGSNYIKYLPPNVTQITFYPNVCGETFDLEPWGKAGDSCTLALEVSDVVDAFDPNPHHHLFACFPGGITCAGTKYPLNVSLRQQAQYAYIAAHDGRDSIFVCQVNDKGFLNNCVKQINSSSFDNPIDVITNSDATYAYILNSGNNSIASCAIQADGSVAECALVQIPTSLHGGLSFNKGFLYFTSDVTNAVFRCSINEASEVEACVSAGNGFNGPRGRVAFSYKGDKAYVSNFTDNTVSICDVQFDGYFDACTKTTQNVFNHPLSMTIDPAGVYLYVANVGNTITSCVLTENGIDHCAVLSDASFQFSGSSLGESNLVVNNNQLAYVPNSDTGSISVCPILRDGFFGRCQVIFGNGSFSKPSSAWISFGQ